MKVAIAFCVGMVIGACFGLLVTCVLIAERDDKR